MSDIPEKPYYKIGEVCQYTDTQPYVLRFWESEFPQLAPEKSRSGQRMYTRRDIDLVLRIKKLLYEEEFTIAGARKRLDLEEAQAAGSALESLLPDGPAHRDEAPPPEPQVRDEPRELPFVSVPPPAEPEPAPPEPTVAADVAGETRLEARVRELEERAAALEQEVVREREAAGRGRDRMRSVADRLERLLSELERKDAGAP